MIFFLVGIHKRGDAQVSLTTFGTAYTQDFNTLSNSAPSSTVPAGWAFSESGTGANTTYGVSDGNVNTGNTYSYGVVDANDRAFGGLQSGSLIPTIGGTFANNTGGIIGSLIVSYKGEQWRLGTIDRIDRLDFQYSTDATSLITGMWTDVNSLDFISPTSTGPLGPLDGNSSVNSDVINSSISLLSIGNGSTFWIRWNDLNASGADDGQAVDSFSITPCPLVTCPANISVCVNAPAFNLTGGAPSGGNYSGTGVSMNQFNPANAGVGVHTITYTHVVGDCTGSCTFTITVMALPNVIPGDYGPACTNDPNINLVGSPPGGIWTGVGVVNGNQFDPNAGTQTIHYTVTGANGCTATGNTTITVNPCLMAPEMRWVLLQSGEQNPPNTPPNPPTVCVSNSDCENNTICFGLQYTPSITGTMTSYTTSFILNCYNNGTNPVVSNTSCVLTNNSNNQNLCATFGQIRWNFLGATTSWPVVAGTPLIIHQVCYTVPPGAPQPITQFAPFSVAIDQSSTIHLTDQPAYVPFSIDGSLYCTLLPVRYLEFNADKFGELTTRLDWVTAEEINNDYFEVQRSNNINGDFETIGRVEAVEHPRSVNPYQFYDYAARPGVNHYRLKQFDRDGQFAYSPIRSVTFSTSSFSVKAWPNPVDNMLNVYISHADATGRLELVDMSGRTVTLQNFEKGDSNHEIDVNGIIPGVYSLVVTTGEERYVEKIVVLE